MTDDQSPRAGDGNVLAALQLAEEIATERLAACRVANEGYPHRCVGEVRDLQTIRAGLAALASAPAAAPAPAPEVRSFTRTAAPAALQPEQYTVLLGQIQKRLAPIQVTAEGLAQLGFPYRTERGLKLYLPSDFAEICERISQHVLRLAAEAKKAA